MGVLVGYGKAAIHTCPSTSLVVVRDPFTPYVSLVSKISSTPTQSRVQGVPSMPQHPKGPKPCTLSKTESISPVYVDAVKQHVIIP